MAEQAKPKTAETTTETTQPSVAPAAKPARQGGMDARNNQRNRQRGRGRKGGERGPQEFDTRLISVRRVSRSYKGGKRLRLSACVAVGDYKGRVGIGVAKGTDVREAQAKATENAKKRLSMVLLKGTTIPHDVTLKVGSAEIFLKPAAPGTGLIAGGPVRSILELAGVKDILSKELGSRNAINNAYVTLHALKTLRSSRL